LAQLHAMRIGRSLTSEFNHLVAIHHASPLFKGRKRGNINPLSIAYASPPRLSPLSIAYASPPRLRSRLTQGRKTWPWKPWVYGGPGSHRSYRYSCLHPLFSTLQFQSPSTFNVLRMLLYRALPKARHPELRYHAYRQSFSAQGLSMSKLLRTF